MINIPKRYGSLKFSGLITWNMIFRRWEEAESHQETWKKHWEGRGFESWREWREDYISPFKPASLKWFLFQITDPVKDSLSMFGVPSKTWSKLAYAGETTKRLQEIKNLPIVVENPKVIAIRENFPQKTLLTAVVNGGRIVLVEGMHRSCALATWPTEKDCFEEVFLALAVWKKEIPTIGGNFKRN